MPISRTERKAGPLATRQCGSDEHGGAICASRAASCGLSVEYSSAGSTQLSHLCLTR